MTFHKYFESYHKYSMASTDVELLQSFNMGKWLWSLLNGAEIL